MCKLFDKWSNQIRQYCDENGFDFEKASQLSQCWGKNFVALQFHDPQKGLNGLLDETPMPLVLMITETSNGLHFDTTEYTERFLKKVS